MFFAIVIVLAAVGIVSWPLLRGAGKNSPGVAEDSAVSDLLAQKDTVLFAINELESDYETGSLSKNDYQELRGKYEEKAVGLIKTVDELKSELDIIEETSPLEDEIEAEVSRLRRTKKAAPGGQSCPGCGAIVAADDRFCARCGATLSARCPACGTKVKPQDQFCFRCGAVLASGQKRRQSG